MILVPCSPRFVGQRIDLSRAVVSLVEGDGNETRTLVFGVSRLWIFVPVIDDRGRNWFHAFLSLKTRM